MRAVRRAINDGVGQVNRTPLARVFDVSVFDMTEVKPRCYSLARNSTPQVRGGVTEANGVPNTVVLMLFTPVT